MELDGRSAVVTGGAGFIGSCLVDRLLRENVKQVVIYDNFSTGRSLNVRHLSSDSRVKLAYGDILSPQTLEAEMVDADIVFHQAAQLEILGSIRSPQEDAKVNILGTINALTAALASGVKKLVFASSAGCYGQAQYIPQDENHPLRPQWSYGVSKLAAEKYCLQFYELYGMETVALRYAIVYGIREWYRRVMTVFIKNALEGDPPVIFGDGQQTRDFVYVDDVVEANILAAKSDAACGQEINIGSGVPTSIRELASVIIKLTGKENTIEPRYANPKDYERGRKPSELRYMCLSIDKAERLLGWKPKITMEEGLMRYINWLRANKNSYWGNGR